MLKRVPLGSSVWCPEWVLCDFFRREPQAAGTGGDGFAEADDRSGSLLCRLRRSPEGPPWEEGEEEAEESHRSKWTNMQLESWPPCGNPPASRWENGCFVSFPQLKPCGSPHAGWEGSMCSHFPFCWGFLSWEWGGVRGTITAVSVLMGACWVFWSWQWGGVRGTITAVSVLMGACWVFWSWQWGGVRVTITAVSVLMGACWVFWSWEWGACVDRCMLGFLKLRMGWVCWWVHAGFSEAKNGVGWEDLSLLWVCWWVFAGFSEADNGVGWEELSLLQVYWWVHAGFCETDNGVSVLIGACWVFWS